MAMVMENQQPLAPMPLVVPTPPLPPPPPPPPPLPPPPRADKHKVCKEGFVRGRVLGGHMRAHGVTDDGLDVDGGRNANDDDDSGPSGGVGGGGAWDSSSEAGASKHMYSLRTNEGRHKNRGRACEICGKEFTSWKLLVDHGRCKHDLLQKTALEMVGANDIHGEDEGLALAGGGWSKNKRPRQTKVIGVDDCSPIDQPPLPPTSREEEDLANWLVMLSSSHGGVQSQATVDVQKDEYASTSKHEQTFLVPPQPISMLPPTVPHFKQFLASQQVMPSPAVMPRGPGLFECKACKKVFTSHQALGGHRASHKKVKGCFAAKLAEESSHNDSPQPSATPSSNKMKEAVAEAIPATVDAIELNGVDGNAEAGNMMVNAGTTTTSPPEMASMQVDEAPSSSTVACFKRKGIKVHECSICHRVFTSGQALGGHKRCHWFPGTDGALTASVIAALVRPEDRHAMHPVVQQLTLCPPMYDTSGSCLDLNVPMNNQSAGPAATRQQAAEVNESMLGLNAPASLYMHPWANASNKMHNTTATNGHYNLTEATATEDEADSRSAKRAKISDLKDMNVAGETSAWLQVGIALPSETSERLLEPKG